MYTMRSLPAQALPQRFSYDTKQTFSGPDVMVLFTSLFTDKPFIVSTQVQTITISSTTSVMPVRRCGETRAISYGVGARSFAGSIIFTIIDQDPFEMIFGLKENATPDRFHIDQLPAFDIILLAQNETQGIGAQIISNVRLINWGTTYSVDDMYLEASYTYVAEHVTPFLATIRDSNLQLPLAPGRDKGASRTPDDIGNSTTKNPERYTIISSTFLPAFKAGRIGIIPPWSRQ